MLRAAAPEAEPPDEGNTVDALSVDRWFAAYLADFIALGRGDAEDVHRLVARYGVPLLVSTDKGSRTLDGAAEVLAFAHQQIAELRATDYDGSRELEAETVVLNRSCATRCALLSRLRADGTEIARLPATYLITGAGQGRRISAIVVHAAP